MTLGISTSQTSQLDMEKKLNEENLDISKS